MDVTQQDPESQSVTVALAWALGVMGAVPCTWESQGSTRHVLFSLFFKKNCSSHLLHVLKKHMQHKEILAIILGDWTQSYTQGLFLRELFNPAAGKCPVQHLACPQPGGIKTYLGIKESRQGGFKQWHNLAGSMLLKKLLQWWIHPLNLCIDPAQSKPTGQVNPHPSAGVTLCIQMSHGII